MSNKLKKMNDEITKMVWSTKDLSAKKKILIEYIGEQTNIPEYIRIRDNIVSAKTPSEVDKIVTNMLLASEGIGVTGLLKR
jgi:hypothetical protein